MSETNYFLELARVDCSKHIEHKGGLSYLSWPWAVQELLRRHPDATWQVKEWPVPGDARATTPYCLCDAGAFVEVSVKVGDVVRSQVHPVLDTKNKPIKLPDAFHINTSIMRCLVKAIALHGLGLSIYAGEDVPTVDADAPEPEDPRIAAKIATWVEAIGNCDPSQLKSVKAEMVAAYGGEPDKVPQVLIAAYNVRTAALRNKAAT